MKIIQIFLLLFLSAMLANELLMTFKIQYFIVQTGSMEPNIPTMSLIIIKPEVEYKIGDIITKTDENTVTHRIISIRNHKYIQTKGDANNFPDPFWITNEKILGKVWLIFPYFQNFGYLITFLGLGIFGGNLFRKLWVFGMLEP